MNTSLFSLSGERKSLEQLREEIQRGVEFKGSNLWVLVSAILVASLGLNLNSTAVIIGAMLISPLMGPIVGIGFSVATSDLPLLRSSLRSLGFSALSGLFASTLYFVLSPLSEAHSEILARTSPTVFDVLIALFGGIAGAVALTSQRSTNVMPGVAIATALMPPLCSSGFGIATSQPGIAFGAAYLFVINSVFIAVAAFVVIRLAHYPSTFGSRSGAEKRTHRIVWFISSLTLLPSVYLGYDYIRQIDFEKRAQTFLRFEAGIPGEYVLEKQVDAHERSISIVYGGKQLDSMQIQRMRDKLGLYNLGDAQLIVKQGFDLSNEGMNQVSVHALQQLVAERERENTVLKRQLDSIRGGRIEFRDVETEIRSQYPALRSVYLSPVRVADSLRGVLVNLQPRLSRRDEEQLLRWMKVRVQSDTILIGSL